MKLICSVAFLIGVSPAMAFGDEIASGGQIETPAAAMNARPSSLSSMKTRDVLALEISEHAAFLAKPECGAAGSNKPAIVYSVRECEYIGYIDLLSRQYRVTQSWITVDGVYVETFRPAAGVSPENRHRILINLHGGGFIGGARVTSKIESIPVAAVGGVEVFSVDYRQGPDHVFPAAVEDVIKVYRQLLKNHSPKQIGIYGCSAGGLLTAQTVARIVADGMPVPGAVAMSCTGANYWTDGDSGSLFGQALAGGPIASIKVNPYFKGVGADDPLAFPALAPRTMARFPPTLLVSGTRDFGLSSIVNTHAELVAGGVESELHVWEGLGHAFLYDPRLPESQSTYKILSSFFNRHLAR